MSKETAVIVLGFLTFVMPFTGFPEGWRTIFFMALGAGLVALGFFLRADTLARRSKRAGDAFTENLHRDRSIDVHAQSHEETHE